MKPEPLVLVVEDHDDSRVMLGILMSMSGWRVVEAVNGQEAIELATSTVPNLILLDMKIPGLDGLTVARMIRDNPTLRQIPIVAITGNAFPKFQDEVIAAGCDYCFIKPIDIERLEGVINSLVSNGHEKAQKAFKQGSHF